MQSIFFKNEKHTVAEEIRYWVFVALGSIVPLVYFFYTGVALLTPYLLLLFWMFLQKRNGLLRQKWALATSYFICLVILYTVGIYLIDSGESDPEDSTTLSRLLVALSV